MGVKAKGQATEGSVISLNDRIGELSAFQAFMELDLPHELIRAKVIVQNYVCFVYLGEACFKALRKSLPNGSTAKKCCKFLTDNPVRAFRNALAHGNWRYLPDFSGLEYWAQKGSDATEPLSKFVVSQEELNFWSALARCTAYSIYAGLYGFDQSS